MNLRGRLRNGKAPAQASGTFRPGTVQSPLPISQQTAQWKMPCHTGLSSDNLEFTSEQQFAPIFRFRVGAAKTLWGHY